MRRVIWTDTALSNLESIVSYIEEFSPTAAFRLGLQLKSAGDGLAQHPERGRVADGRLRELVVVSPYIIRYRVQDDTVVVLRIRHGMRKPLRR